MCNSQINAAGRRYLDLVKNQWSTKVNVSLSGSHDNIDIRGFYGDYDVIVHYMGKPIRIEHFSVYKGEDNQDVMIQINGTGG